MRRRAERIADYRSAEDERLDRVRYELAHETADERRGRHEREWGKPAPPTPELHGFDALAHGIGEIVLAVAFIVGFLILAGAALYLLMPWYFVIAAVIGVAALVNATVPYWWRGPDYMPWDPSSPDYRPDENDDRESRGATS